MFGLRYENVDQDGISENADALTARVAPQLQDGLMAQVASPHLPSTITSSTCWMTSTRAAGPARIEVATRSLPILKGPDLNQLYLRLHAFTHSGEFSCSAGRRIVLDNHRFVGRRWLATERFRHLMVWASRDDRIGSSTRKLQYSYVADVRSNESSVRTMCGMGRTSRTIT